jgi:hypothetical protein
MIDKDKMTHNSTFDEPSEATAGSGTRPLKR